MAVTGLVYISINGQRVHSEPDATFKPGGPAKKAAMSVLGYVGSYADEIKPSEVKFKIRHTDDLDVAMLQGLQNQTLTFETDSGQRYLMRGATVIEEVELSKTFVEITMQGAPAELV